MTASLDKASSLEQPPADSSSNTAPTHAKRQASQNEGNKGDASPEAAAGSPKEPAAKRRTLCGVCHNEAAKYKCPRCSVAYCSVTCSRNHRDSHPSEKDDAAAEAAAIAAVAAAAAAAKPSTSIAATEVRRHPFSVLDDSSELKRLFSKYPHLPSRLRSIYEATLPPTQRQQQQAPSWDASSRGRGRGGHRGSSRGGAGGGGRGGSQTGGPAPGHDQPWTTELGLRQGQKALRRARVDPGEDGDGVREYCELVTFLLSRGQGDKIAASAPTSFDRHSTAVAADDAAIVLVQQEVLQGDVSLIKQLLEAEGRQ